MEVIERQSDEVNQTDVPEHHLWIMGRQAVETDQVQEGDEQEDSTQDAAVVKAGRHDLVGDVRHDGRDCRSCSRGHAAQKKET